MEHATLDDRRESNPGPSYSVTTPETLEAVEEYFQKNPTSSIRMAAAVLNLNRETLRLILTRFLELHPYKVQVRHRLETHHKEKRLAFAKEVVPLIHNETLSINNIIFSDESHFYLDNYVNKQNMRFWGTERPDFSRAKSLHPVRVTVWAAICVDFLRIEMFTNTVTGESYDQLLKEKFLPFVRRKGFRNTHWFMQDGATPHRTSQIFSTLHSFFDEHVIGLGYPRFSGGGLEWPPYSPDLNPCDYFLWGFMKDKVYAKQPKDLKELQKSIDLAAKSITAEMRQNVINGFLRRLECLTQSDGGHFENITH